MKWIWCWRCRQEVPMLDDEEFAKAEELNKQGLHTPGSTMPEKFHAIINFYYDLTGERYENANAIMHHVISHYGPPCEVCGKPYRTPGAAFCAECGHRRI